MVLLIIISKKTKSSLCSIAFNMLIHQGDIKGRLEQNRVQEGKIITVVELGSIIMAKSRFNLSQLYKSPNVMAL